MQRKYTKMIAVNGIRPVSNYDSQYEKDQSHQMTKLQSMIVVYITVTIYYFFNGFYFMFFWGFFLISGFLCHFFTSISGYINKKF